jgi:hypothetical protein
MFHHVKCVASWITMAYHVYDHVYYKMLTIVVCDMQSEDTEVRQLMWTMKYVEAWVFETQFQNIHG